MSEAKLYIPFEEPMKEKDSRNDVLYFSKKAWDYYKDLGLIYRVGIQYYIGSYKIGLIKR